MAKRKPALRFRWTEQSQRLALLLSALGRSNEAIARRLGCDISTVGRHLGPRDKRPRLSADQLRDLSEQYDAWRNVEEVLNAESGTTRQARLRTSLRLRKSKQDPPGGGDEGIDREELRRDVEALVAHKRRVRGDI